MTTSWPVAPIPEDHPRPTLTAGVLIPLRWPLHGDLRIVIDDALNVSSSSPAVHISADDIHALAQLEDEDETPHPTIRPRATWGRTDGAELISLYTLHEAVAVLEHAPTHATGELLDWIRQMIPLVTGDEVLNDVIGLESFLDAYTVAQAALILDRDPHLALGRQRLFAQLHRLGWATRDDAGRWAPTPTATRGHFLTLRTVTILAGTRAAEPYRQLYVTRAGLAELRHALGALHTEPPDPDTNALLPLPL